MPAAVRERSASNAASRTPKKARSQADQGAQAAINHPSAEDVTAYREKYVNAAPFRHAVIGGLLSDDLLEGVVEESKKFGTRGEEGSLPGWGWEHKETDIYKIQQTPDLSSLSPEHLPDETLDALPLLTRLKNALYSQEFRNLVRQVTGCGPLSGTKTDLSCALYTKGSHLLLHDDSISTRLISYILYLPWSPKDASETSDVNLELSKNGKFLKGWSPSWGGGLELFPVEGDEEVGPPSVKRLAKVSATWGQIVFFEVQPGRSYHAVEEVVIDEGRQRFSVSGWFHRPVEGEEGFQVFDKEKAQKELSSLAQITSAPSLPFVPYPTPPPTGLKPSDLAFLSNYLSASYLTAPTLERLSGQFVEASEIVLHNFLQPELAAKLKAETEGVDKRDYSPLKTLLTPQETGEGDGWAIQGPSSKHRYVSLTDSSTSTPIFQSIHNVLFPSQAFRAWLSVVSSLAPTGHRNEARRFRKGLDYTLANGEGREGDARLDVSLGATWWADVPAGSDEEDTLIEHGGWEAYLAAPDEDEDPAVYQSSMAKKPKHEHQQEENGAREAASAPEKQAAPQTNGGGSSKAHGGPSISMGGQELEFDPDQFSPSDFDSDSEHGEEDDGPLLTQPVAFNKLLLVLRDPGVMKFVKYLGANAPGSRWDVQGEYEVGVLEEEVVGEEGSGEVQA
ncbi:hypothetical protein IAR50_001890 [Cryptococcus sp. DSM 104548]